MVNRNVALALGIICIILLAGFGVIIGYFTMTIDDKDRTITNLNDIINLANYTVVANNQTVTQAAGNYTSWTFTANVTGYVFVTILSSTTNNTYVRVIYNASIPTFSTENGAATNYQWVVYPEGAWDDYQYDNQVNLGNGYGNLFPVYPWLAPSYIQLPLKGPTIVEVRVGNTNIVGNATENVLIIYYY
jgi:Ca2+-binding RTX toxin-like protein